ncbi:VWA domain-containing protein [Bacillus spizizenii]|nr:VWA domain-containing protein [Bacillus spizizenii]MCY7839335.1 VWA domain-containing protein [Bacillus spizizenii]MCY9313626.1 VWA domain-containing protein [Bacillus spizizenii]MEC0562865.1 VWA domain-containing protein [Bacillus spizizenii]
MDKFQEIKNRFSIATSLYKKQIDVNWSTILEDQEFLIQSVEKQQEIIEENKRQQEVTVHQFRQARDEIQWLQAECSQINKKFKKAIRELRDIRDVAKIGSAAYLFAKNALAALEGDAK